MRTALHLCLALLSTPAWAGLAAPELPAEVMTALEGTTTRTRTDDGGVSVQGTAWWFQPWCQGAAPPDGIGTVRRPYQGALHLREGQENSEVEPVTTIRPDEQGSFELTLAPGWYCVQTPDRMDSLEQRLEAARAAPVGQERDLACVEQDWRSCRTLLEVTPEGVDGANIHIVDRCGWSIPCAKHPMAPPPSAAPGG